MYAVIETGGKQYRVSPGQTIEVELLPAEPGSTVTLDEVLLVSAGDETLVGAPFVPGAKVVTIVARESRGPKVLVFKYKSKKRYRRTHRPSPGLHSPARDGYPGQRQEPGERRGPQALRDLGDARCGTLSRRSSWSRLAAESSAKRLLGPAMRSISRSSVRIA